MFCIYTLRHLCFIFFFFNDTATTEIYTLSLHDALPISLSLVAAAVGCRVVEVAAERAHGSLSPLPSRVRTRHPVAGLRVQGRWRRTLREPQLLLHQVAADPHDPIPAHDCVHRIRLTRERLGIRGRDL